MSHRFVRAVSLLTIALFLLSASVDATLNRLENSPRESQLAIYSPTGHLRALYRGDLAQLKADEKSDLHAPGVLHRLRTAVQYRWL